MIPVRCANEIDRVEARWRRAFASRRHLTKEEGVMERMEPAGFDLASDD